MKKTRQSCCNVEVQKGKINPNIQTQKNMTPTEIEYEDRSNRVLRKSGQGLTLHTPKT